MMSSYIYTALLAICLFITHPASAADDLPQAFEAAYTLHRKGIKIAKMKRSFSHLQNGKFLYRSETITAGLLSLFRKDRVIEQSTWYLDEQQIRPILYSYEHTGGKKERNVIIKFDWTAKRITNSINGDSWQMQTRPNIMDKLLYQFAIMQDIKAGKDPLVYTIADGGKIKTYNFEVLGEEVIHTKLGKLHTLKLERHKSNSKRKTTFWCARDLNYLPVRVEHIAKDGSKTTAVINSLTGLTLEPVASVVDSLAFPDHSQGK